MTKDEYNTIKAEARGLPLSFRYHAGHVKIRVRQNALTFRFLDYDRALYFVLGVREALK